MIKAEMSYECAFLKATRWYYFIQQKLTKIFGIASRHKIVLNFFFLNKKKGCFFINLIVHLIWPDSLISKIFNDHKNNYFTIFLKNFKIKKKILKYRKVKKKRLQLKKKKKVKNKSKKNREKNYKSWKNLKLFDRSKFILRAKFFVIITHFYAQLLIFIRVIQVYKKNNLKRNYYIENWIVNWIENWVKIFTCVTCTLAENWDCSFHFRSPLSRSTHRKCYSDFGNE